MVLTAAALEKNTAAIERHMAHISQRNLPAEFSSAYVELWQFALRQLSQDAAGQVALGFVRAGNFAVLPEDLQRNFSSRAVRPALKAGDNKLAVELSTRFTNPYSMIGELIDRDYEAIWPELAEAAGPHMAKVLAAQVEESRQAADGAPGDREKLSDLVAALVMSGQFAEAIKAAAKVDHSPRAARSYVQHDAWAINYETGALDRLGRTKEADALFDRIATLAPGKERGWVVNFAINRADRLLGMSRWAEALPAAELAVKVATDHGSAYAKEDAAATRFCAAYKLDPARSELAVWWTQVEAGWKDNVGGAVVAAQCKGDLATARRFLRDGLEDPNQRNTVLRLLQPVGFDLYRDAPGVFDQPGKLIEDDPELAALFEKYGRKLPAELLPDTKD